MSLNWMEDERVRLMSLVWVLWGGFSIITIKLHFIIHCLQLCLLIPGGQILVQTPKEFGTKINHQNKNASNLFFLHSGLCRVLDCSESSGQSLYRSPTFCV